MKEVIGYNGEVELVGMPTTDGLVKLHCKDGPTIAVPLSLLPSNVPTLGVLTISLKISSEEATG